MNTLVSLDASIRSVSRTVDYLNFEGGIPTQEGSWKIKIINSIKPQQELLFVFEIPDEILVNKNMVDTANSMVEARGIVKKGFVEEPYEHDYL